MYQFSLKAFRSVFEVAMDRAEPADDIQTRVKTLLDSITFSVYMYTSRGLFEKDKLIFTAQMVFQIMTISNEINPVELDFLLRFPIIPNLTSPVDFITNNGWGGIKALSNMETFRNLDKDIEGSAKRWKNLCYFHAVICERRKFGPQGWNRIYPFNTGDLTISVSVLYNYLEANSKVPWEDLRYLFGDIMYGGHITDDWDRRLCKTYLEEYLVPEMLDGDHCLAPNFKTPQNTDYKGYHQYIDEFLPQNLHISMDYIQTLKWNF
uniref:Dynein heavy chain AAA lid domain-containing protein n=1 Tax=Trichobilharzia regenti TaxID=157069 RepID=A0AA85JP20_TRIRE|nr:unnamed protein product [Trichobilharzia regenti]